MCRFAQAGLVLRSNNMLCSYKTDKKRYEDTARQWTHKYAMG